MSRPRRLFRSRFGATRGYTAVEVLMAMTVMAVGAAGVISMQKASIQGNLDARKTDVANSIARAWIERIKRDAMLWTQPGPSNPTGGNLASAPILNAGINTNNGTWFLPLQDIALTGSTALSPGFDILGRDLPQADLAKALFCANVRMTWLPVPAAPQDLIRVEVRVLWPRGITGNTLPAGGTCNATVAVSNAPSPLVYHAIYAVTAVRGNPQ
jgi:type IV pilus assembly protein PilV